MSKIQTQFYPNMTIAPYLKNGNLNNILELLLKAVPNSKMINPQEIQGWSFVAQDNSTLLLVGFISPNFTMFRSVVYSIAIKPPQNYVSDIYAKTNAGWIRLRANCSLSTYISYVEILSNSYNNENQTLLHDSIIKDIIIGDNLKLSKQLRDMLK